MGITFDMIWRNYPSDFTPCRNSRTNQPVFENQCAIRVGLALQRAGVNFGSFRGDRCPSAPHNTGMVISAQALANWLLTRPFSGCPRAEHYTGSTVFDEISDLQGIIFFSDYWQRPGEVGTSRRTGDHIDLWNGERLTSLSSFVRVHLHFSIDGYLSDFRRSPRVLFWRLQGEKNSRTVY